MFLDSVTSPTALPDSTTPQIPPRGKVYFIPSHFQFASRVSPKGLVECDFYDQKQRRGKVAGHEGEGGLRHCQESPGVGLLKRSEIGL